MVTVNVSVVSVSASTAPPINEISPLELVSVRTPSMSTSAAEDKSIPPLEVVISPCILVSPVVITVSLLRLVPVPIACRLTAPLPVEIIKWLSIALSLFKAWFSVTLPPAPLRSPLIVLSAARVIG